VIEEFCLRRGLAVVDVVEDVETAASAGRTGFGAVLDRLERREADGVVFHKVDRSSRNFRDWLTISDLMDGGLYVGFASEGLESTEASGRLTMDILAATAVHYIRNLKGEIKKGLRGRIHQGLWPRQAPIGYLNPPPGTAKADRCRKRPDPILAPFIKTLFERYATGEYTLDEVTHLAREIGFTRSGGRPRSRSCIAQILDNPFYAGLLRYDGEIHPGAHEAIIDVELFERVREVRQGNRNKKGATAATEHLYQRLLTCGFCGRLLIAEVKKGHVYYRCHSPNAGTTCIREEAITEAIARDLGRLEFSVDEIAFLRAMVRREASESDRERVRQGLQLEANRVKSDLDRLTRSMVSGSIAEERYNALREEFEGRERVVAERLKKLDSETGERAIRERFVQVLERLNLCYVEANKKEQRVLLRSMYSNLSVRGKFVSAEPRKWLAAAMRRELRQPSAVDRGAHRNCVDAANEDASWRAVAQLIDEKDAWQLRHKRMANLTGHSMP